MRITLNPIPPTKSELSGITVILSIPTDMCAKLLRSLNLKLPTCLWSDDRNRSAIPCYSRISYVSLISITPFATCAISSTYQCSQRLRNFYSPAKVCNARAPYHYYYKNFTKIGSPSAVLPFGNSNGFFS